MHLTCKGVAFAETLEDTSGRFGSRAGGGDDAFQAPEDYRSEVRGIGDNLYGNIAPPPVATPINQADEFNEVNGVADTFDAGNGEVSSDEIDRVNSPGSANGGTSSAPRISVGFANTKGRRGSMDATEVTENLQSQRAMRNNLRWQRNRGATKTNERRRTDA